MNDARKGAIITKLDLSVIVDKKMLDDPMGIYVSNFRVEHGRDGEYVNVMTLYSHCHHDFDIDGVLRRHNLASRRIKEIRITAIMKNGDSISKVDEIKKWKVTHEEKSKD